MKRVQCDLDSAWTADADDLLAELAGHDVAVEVVYLSGSNNEKFTPARIDFADRIKQAYPLSVVVVQAAAATQAALAAALVAHRIDLVDMSEPSLAHPDALASLATGT